MSLHPLLKDRLRLPIIGSPLFIVSVPKLVIAQCKAGIVGSFPALNARPKELLEQWIVEIKTELAAYQKAHPEKKVAPFAVNQIVHASNDRLEHDVEMCIKHQVPIIITSLRPPGDVVKAVHSYGGIVLHDVINVRHAKKALGEGVDGLILVSAGAGGHAGTFNPFALVHEVRQFFDGTLVLAGAISTGDTVLAAQAIGADLAYMGTRFIASQEANAPDAYKQMIVDTNADDIVYTPVFSGVNANYLKPSVRNAGLDPDKLDPSQKHDMKYGSEGSSKSKAWRDIWSAGHGVGSIHSAPSVAEIVDQFEREYRAAQHKIATLAG